MAVAAATPVLSGLSGAAGLWEIGAAVRQPGSAACRRGAVELGDAASPLPGRGLALAFGAAPVRLPVG
jgi:hypothetical protein